MAEKTGREEPGRERPVDTCGVCGMEILEGVCSGCGNPPDQCTCKK